MQAVAKMNIKARDDSGRGSSSRVPAKGAAAGKDHSQAKINAVLAMDMDYKPFFYSAAGRGEAGETLVVASANGHCVRVHIASRTMDPPTRVSTPSCNSDHRLLANMSNMPLSQLFSFHTGELWGLSNAGSLGNIFVTGQ